MPDRLEAGTRIRITLKWGVLEGTVIQGRNWGGLDGWFIEFEEDRKGYCYYKERYDGGTVEVLEDGKC